jgi:hypothetical protein
MRFCIAPVEEPSLFGLSLIHPGSFVFRGRKTYRYDLDGDQLKVINENGALDYSVSDAHGLVSVGDQVGFPTVIQKADRSVEISSQGWALNHFFETGTSVAGILVEADGYLRPYSAEPTFLPGSYKSTTIHGNPSSLVFSRDENTVCVVYNDGHLLAAQLNEKRITHAREILLPQHQAASLRLFACDADRVIFDTGEGPRLLDLKNGNSIELKGRNLQSATLLEIDVSPFFLGIDFNGNVDSGMSMPS